MRYTKVIKKFNQLYQGRIYSKQGPVREKCGGKSPGTADPIFPKKNWRPFSVITVRVSAVSSPEKLATFFDRHCRFYLFHSFTRVSPIISGMQKIAAPFVGPLFVGPLFGRTC